MGEPGWARALHTIKGLELDAVGNGRSWEGGQGIPPHSLPISHWSEMARGQARLKEMAR